jgi:hypothetical protein
LDEQQTVEFKQAINLEMGLVLNRLVILGTTFAEDIHKYN